VTVLLARAVRLAGAGRSAPAGGYCNIMMGCTGGQTYGPLIKSPDEDLPQDTQQEQSAAKGEDL